MLVSGNGNDEKNLQPGGRKKLIFDKFNLIFQIKFTLKKVL